MSGPSLKGIVRSGGDWLEESGLEAMKEEEAPPTSLQNSLPVASVCPEPGSLGGQKVGGREGAFSGPSPHCWGKAGMTMDPGARFGFRSRLCHLLDV